MPNTRALQLSFNGGEISPEMYGRIDLKVHQSGLRRARNMYVKTQGSARRRPGFRYCGEVFDSGSKTRLISLSSSPATVVEVSANKFRFYRDGAPLLRTGVPLFFATRTSVSAATGTGIWTSASIDQQGFGTNSLVTVIHPSVSTDPGYANPIVTDYPYARIATITLTNVGEKTGIYQASAPHNLRDNDAVTLQQGGNRYLFYIERIDSTNFAFRTGYQGTARLMTIVAWSLNNGTQNGTLHSIVTPSSPEYPGACYYIDRLSSTTWRLKRTIDGTPITAYLTNGSGSSLMAIYATGETVFSSPDYYRAKIPARSDYLLTATQYWTNEGPAPEVTITHGRAYTEQQLFELTYAQSNDVLTLAHRSHPTTELLRYSDTQWDVRSVSFSAKLLPPASFTTAASTGESLRITRTTDSSGIGLLQCDWQGLSIVAGDSVKFGPVTQVTGMPTGLAAKLNNNIFSVANSVVQSGTQNIQFVLKANGQTNLNAAGLAQIGDQLVVGTGGGVFAAPVFFQFWPEDSTSTNLYVITAVDDTDVESRASAPISVTNNLFARETFNTITWSPVANAVQYRIYRLQSGLYGLIGKADNNSGLKFVDNNLPADIGITPPIPDDSLAQAGEYPSCVSYWDQRKVFAGTSAKPSRLWMTKANTETDLSFTLPIKDSDRISIQVATREINRIRHVVSASELLVLTDLAEWRITAINSDAITPSTVSVRPQSFVGSNYVTPVIVNNSVVYCASRGGRVRELGFSFNSQGYVGTDLSLRASHLFEDLSLVDLAQMRSPIPVLWFVSSNGKLLGLTYTPEEQVAAWHQHDTDGAFESVASILEGDKDVLYAVVKRTINGVTKRYVEALDDLRVTGDEGVFVDSYLTFDNTHTGNRQLQISQYQSSGFGLGSTVTVSVVGAHTVFAVGDVGSRLVLTATDGSRATVEISEYVSASVVRGRAVADIPSAFWETAISSWAFARRTYSGLGHLVGETVQIVADGERLADQVVPASGSITLESHAVFGAIGIGYVAEMQTLPIALQADAAGQGRTKNINKAWFRLDSTDTFDIGPDESNLVPSVTLDAALVGDEIQTTLLPSWTQDGSVLVRQTAPFPLNVNGLVLEVAVGS